MHHDDDVAKNIRNQMAEAAAPSSEEAAAMARKHLAAEGCAICGEDDPDELMHEHHVTHSCPAHQHPRDLPERVVCEDGHASPAARWWQDKQVQATRRGHPLVVYDCRVTEWAEPPEVDDVLTRHGYQQPPPEAPVECVCGAGVWTIVYPRGDD